MEASEAAAEVDAQEPIAASAGESAQGGVGRPRAPPLHTEVFLFGGRPGRLSAERTRIPRESCGSGPRETVRILCDADRGPSYHRCWSSSQTQEKTAALGT